MLAGRRPFAGDSHAALLHAVLAEEPAPLPGAVPDALSSLVRALLAKDPADRPAPAPAVAAALRGVASGGARAGDVASGGARGGGPAAGAAASRRAAPLPVPLTGFVGRARELADVVCRLRATRLLTLTGPGGGGKTRLALEVAARAASAPAASARGEDAPARGDAPDAPASGVVWVDLAPVGEPAQVAGQIAAAAGVTERPGGSPLDAVRASMGAAPRLLVLDNCEHVVGACAEAAERLLRACPGLTVLATSREALGVAGEAVWPVPALAADEARRLFVERARAARPDLDAGAAGDAGGAAVDEICRRLDGLPLAIELAAARVRALAPAQIAERLGDAFRLLTAGHRTALPRHRTLRAAMDWSHGLLAEPERVLLRRLAVFAGDFALEAAEAVAAGPALDAADVLDTLAALVDKSLVQAAAPAGAAVRYRLLETVRQYGRERLAQAGEVGAAEEAHVRYYLAVAEAAVPHIRGGMRGQDVLERLAADQHDLRAASTWALRAAERDPARWGDTALRFTDALLWYWYGAGRWLGRGQFTEASEYAEAAVRAGAGGDPMLRARAHLAAGLCGSEAGRGDMARHFVAARELAAAHGDPVVAVLARVNLARALVMRGDAEEARAIAEEAWPAALALPVPMLHGFAAAFLGVTRIECGDLAGARAVAEQVVRTIPPEVEPVPAAHGRAMLGHIEALAGDLDAAARHLRAALAMHLAAYDVHGLALDLDWLAGLAAARGRHDGAARFAGAADALRERVGTARWRTEVAAHERAAGAARRALGAGYDAHYRAGRALGDAELLRLADDLA
jgi:predicted ATPase